ncbi:MAG: hypothetical protein WC436_01885 [Candidatus Babeliales bacterium]
MNYCKKFLSTVLLMTFFSNAFPAINFEYASGWASKIAINGTNIILTNKNNEIWKYNPNKSGGQSPWDIAGKIPNNVNGVNKLVLDKDNNIWIISGESIAGGYKVYFGTPLAPGQNTDITLNYGAANLTKIAANGNHLIGINKDTAGSFCFKYDFTAKTWTNIGKLPDGVEARDLAVDNNGNFWILTNQEGPGGYTLLNGLIQGNTISFQGNPGRLTKIATNGTNFIAINAGNICYKYDGTNWINLGTLPAYFNIAAGNVNDLAADNVGNFWIINNVTTGGGFEVFKGTVTTAPTPSPAPAPVTPTPAPAPSTTPAQQPEITTNAKIPAKFSQPVWFSGWQLQENNKGTITFEAKGANDAIILLASDQIKKDNYQKNDPVYQLVIGGTGNTNTMIGKGFQEPKPVNISGAQMDANNWKKFWITYNNGNIKIGKEQVDQNLIAEWTDPNTTPNIKYFALTTWNVPVEYRNVTTKLITTAAPTPTPTPAPAPTPTPTPATENPEQKINKSITSANNSTDIQNILNQIKTLSGNISITNRDTLYNKIMTLVNNIDLKLINDLIGENKINFTGEQQVRLYFSKFTDFAQVNFMWGKVKEVNNAEIYTAFFDVLKNIVSKLTTLTPDQINTLNSIKNENRLSAEQNNEIQNLITQITKKAPTTPASRPVPRRR